MKDIDFDKLIEPFVKIYQDLEHDLVVKIATHFKLYEDIGFKNSMEWYAKKVEELGGLNQEAVNIISQQTKIPKKKIIEMLKKAEISTLNLEDIQKANDKGIFNIDIDKLISSNVFKDITNNSYKEIDGIFKLINTKALESSSQTYMDVLNRSYTDVRSGLDYNTSIRNALTKMANEGIKVVSYKQKDGSIRRYGIESCVRRDVLTAIVQTTNKASDNFCKEAGYEYFIVSKHLGARVTNTHDYKDHAWWQGKVYKIEGSTKEYPNFQETCNEGDVQGFGGANCRHIKFGYIPGISVPPVNNIDKEENARIYSLNQIQRSYENKIKHYKTQIDVAKVSNDEDKTKTYKDKLKDVDKEYNDFCKENNLKRKYTREYVVSNLDNSNFKIRGGKKELSYKDVTQEWLDKATPNSHELKLDDYFIDDNSIRHPIKNKEVMHPVPTSGEEYEMAIWIKETFGGNIHMIPRITDISNESLKVSTPDYRWKGKKWDLKTPTLNGDFKTALERFMKQSKTKKQSQKFIIDFKYYIDKSDKEIIELAEKTLSNPYRNWIEDLILVKGNKVIKIYSKIK